MPTPSKWRSIIIFLAMAAFLGGCSRAISPADSDQIKQWRSEGRLAAGPWQEPVLYGAHASTVNLLWVRHESRSGLVSLVPVEGAARSSLGTMAAKRPSFAPWASQPWTRHSDTSLTHLPGGCFVLSKPAWGLTVTTPAGAHTWNASQYPERWERACIACARLAVKADDMWSVLGMRGMLGAIPTQPKSELARTLADVDAKIAEKSLSRLTPPVAPSGVAAPSSYVRELPGDTMRAFYGRMRMEMEAAGATYYGR